MTRTHMSLYFSFGIEVGRICDVVAYLKFWSPGLEPSIPG